MNYSFNSRVRYSETGENGKLTLPGVLNYFQDCCTFHAESVGLGGDVLKARDRAWVLSSWQVIVDEYPAMGTEIRITTAPYDFKGFMGMRNFTIETMDGKKLAWANSNWTHLAISTGIPVRLTPADTDNYILGEKLEMDYAPRKIKLPDDMTSQESFTVQKHHLDTNHHVNNCQYICMAEDFLPEDFKSIPDAMQSIFIIYLCSVVICFHFSIFEPLETAKNSVPSPLGWVVICFHFMYL